MASHGAPNVPPHLRTPLLPSAAAPLDTPVLSLLLLLLASRVSACLLGGLRKEAFSSSPSPHAAAAVAAAAAGPSPAAADSLAPTPGTLQSSSPAAAWGGTAASWAFMRRYGKGGLENTLGVLVLLLVVLAVESIKTREPVPSSVRLLFLISLRIGQCVLESTVS